RRQPLVRGIAAVVDGRGARVQHVAVDRGARVGQARRGAHRGARAARVEGRNGAVAVLVVLVVLAAHPVDDAVAHGRAARGGVAGGNGAGGARQRGDRVDGEALVRDRRAGRCHDRHDVGDRKAGDHPGRHGGAALVVGIHREAGAVRRALHRERLVVVAGAAGRRAVVGAAAVEAYRGGRRNRCEAVRRGGGDRQDVGGFPAAVREARDALARGAAGARGRHGGRERERVAVDPGDRVPRAYGGGRARQRAAGDVVVAGLRVGADVDGIGRG